MDTLNGTGSVASDLNGGSADRPATHSFGPPVVDGKAPDTVEATDAVITAADGSSAMDRDGGRSSAPSSHISGESETDQNAVAAGAMARARRANRGEAPRGDDGNSASWCVLVRERATRLEAEFERIEATALTTERESILIDARAHVASARRSTIGNARYKQWWSGSRVENAWSDLRAAEEMIVDLVADAELPALSADAIAHAKYYLTSGDEQVKHLASVRKAYPPAADSSESVAAHTAMRAAIRHVLAASHQQADRGNREVREWRNRLLIGSCITLAATFATIFVLWRVPAIEPIDAPEGWSGGSWQLMTAIAIIGVLGSMFSVIPAMTRVNARGGRYNLPLQQALLKLAFAPLSAMAGVAMVSASGTLGEPEWSILFVLALAFGAAQQAVTRAVDARAETALAAAAPAPAPTTSTEQ